MTHDLPRILLVDDDDDYAESTGALLHASGYEVRRARTAREALRLAREVRPDLVLLDVMMEHATAGLDALAEMRRDPQLAGLPILVVSSIYAEVPGFRISTDPAWLRHDGFVPKPVDYDALLARIGELLAAAPARPA